MTIFIEGSLSMANNIFLDTAFTIALISPKDVFHNKALELSKHISASDSRLTTTRAVLVEIGNALSKENLRTSAVELLDSLEADKTITIVPLSEELYKEAYKLYRSRTDKEWGLTDCVSFVVMKKFGITEVLTTDHHFRQAGFNPLMR